MKMGAIFGIDSAEDKLQTVKNLLDLLNLLMGKRK